MYAAGERSVNFLFLHRRHSGLGKHTQTLWDNQALPLGALEQRDEILKEVQEST